jgi:hypothetical protein
MKNPVNIEYRRSTLLGVILLLILSGLGAAVHYLRSVDGQVSQTKVRLAAVSKQLDSEFAPALAFMEAVRRAALVKLALPEQPPEGSLPILSLAQGEEARLAISTDEGGVNSEVLMLLRLQPYFELAQEAQPNLVNMYYFSEQGFVYNGQPKWSDYIADQVLQWHKETLAEPSYERGQLFFAGFLPQQAAVMLPLYSEDKKLGRFVFAMALEPLLAPLYQQHPDTEFVLLDQSGQLINSSMSRPPSSINQHLLQIQRLNTLPWSLALLKQKTSLFAAGVNEFLWHWISYALLLGVFLLAMQYRFRQRMLYPSQRLIIHIERLANGQSQGVRRVPYGWTEVFENIRKLNQTTSGSE